MPRKFLNGGIQFGDTGGIQAEADVPTYMIGTSAYDIPAATADIHAYAVPVFDNITITRVIITAKSVSTGTITIQLRVGTRSGDLITWADLGSTITLGASDNYIDTTGLSLNVDAGKFLGFSITSGGGSGSGLLVAVQSKRR